jgi:hypothetical protein
VSAPLERILGCKVSSSQKSPIYTKNAIKHVIIMPEVVFESVLLISTKN